MWALRISLYEDNVRFRDFVSKLGYDYHYEEGPGTHEWGYWDMMIQRYWNGCRFFLTQ